MASIGGRIHPRGNPCLLALLAALATASGCRGFDAPPSTQPTLTAATGFVAPLGTDPLSVVGGTPPYVIAFTSQGFRSGGVITAPSGGTAAVYRAGALGDVTDTLQAVDSVGQVSAPVAISVGPALALSPPAANAPVGGRVAFTATGGATPIVFGLSASATCDGGAPTDAGASCLGGAGASCISGAGLYVAGAAAAQGADWVYALDHNGACSVSQVSVGSALQFATASEVAVPGQTLQLTLSGGIAPYQVRFDPHGNLSGGTVTADGSYTAGFNANLVDTLVAADAAGNRARVTVSVGDPGVSLPADGQYWLRRGDFNGDLIDDVAAVSVNPQFPAILIELGGAKARPPIEIDLPYNTDICDVEIGDLNVDGYSDVLLVVAYDSSCDTTFGAYVLSYLGSPTGQLTAGPSLNLYQSVDWWSLESVAVVSNGDVNAPFTAVAVAFTSSSCSSCDRLMFFELPPQPTSATFSTELGEEPFREIGGFDLPQVFDDGSIKAWMAASTDSVGSMDLWVAREPFLATCSPTFPAQVEAFVGITLRADGGLFVPPLVELGSSSVGCDDTVQISAGDLDDDGFPDLELADFPAPGHPGSLVYFLRQDAGLSGPQGFPLPEGTVAGDLGQSPVHLLGEADFVGGTSAARWKWSPSAGSLVPATGWTPLPTAQSGIVRGDFNDDGIRDLVVIDPSNHLRFLLGTLDGQLEQERLFAYGGPPTATAYVGDFDGDGHDDVVGLFSDLEVYLGVGVEGGAPALATSERLPFSNLVDFTLDPGGLWALLRGPDGGGVLDRLTASGGAVPEQEVPVGAALQSPMALRSFPADADAEGERLALFGTDPTTQELLATLVGVGADAGAEPAPVLWTGPRYGTAFALIDALGAGPRDLAVSWSQEGGVLTYLGVFPAQDTGGAPWATDPVIPDGGTFVIPLRTGVGVVGALQSFGLTPEAPRDHLAGRYLDERPLPDGGAYNAIFVASLTPEGTFTEDRFVGYFIPADVNYTPETSATSIQAVDLDGDGNTDLLFFDSAGIVAYILAGDGQGGFVLHLTAFIGPGTEVLAGHFGGEGPAGSSPLPELALIRIDTPQIYLVQNLGNFVFQ